MARSSVTIGKAYRGVLSAWLCIGCVFALSCSTVSTVYKISKGTIKGTYKITEWTVKGTIGTGKAVYKIGEFTFTVVMAPPSWPFTHGGIESIGGLLPKEAVKRGKVKNSPYVVHGKRYVPMSIEEALKYREKGVASWYGYETLRKKGGRMTANGEVFDPEGLSAAHKYLPLPCHVKVTNLENGRSILVRVNDRGPFVKGRIIDLSAGAARRLGFYSKGTATVLVQTVEVAM
ncbi:MAG: septal ring lytic transglycosylase RlpA family protein [Deltaproteobacteria bacterium]|nr:septal ring lytic transglycosylase RlpA family protein [Deltaproteobacteria bacterium]